MNWRSRAHSPKTESLKPNARIKTKTAMHHFKTNVDVTYQFVHCDVNVVLLWMHNESRILRAHIYTQPLNVRRLVGELAEVHLNLDVADF